jgi:hypothetical protein
MKYRQDNIIKVCILIKYYIKLFEFSHNFSALVNFIECVEYLENKI